MVYSIFILIKGGVKCQLAASGRQITYQNIEEIYLSQAIGGRKFDNVAKSPFINYQVMVCQLL